MTPRPAPRWWAVAATALLVASCGISPDASPRDVPEDDLLVDDPGDEVSSDASGGDRIFLVGPGEDRLLRSVPREASSRQNLMEILLAGPNVDELEAQYVTAIPTSTRLVSTPRSQGNVFFIDVSEDLLELTGAGLTQALAQIVYTANELDGVNAVQLSVNGDSTLSWPKGNGQTSSDPLRVFDYPGFVRTAQPDYPVLPAGGS